MEIRIKKNALESALESCKHAHPKEFLGLFRGEKRGEELKLKELIIPPLSRYFLDSVVFSPWMLPIDPTIKASLHSHPNGTLKPSKADLAVFPGNGEAHFIAGPPYSTESVKCFDNRGREILFLIEK